MHIADAKKVIAWQKSNPRKPAIHSFTEGPERQAAYWIEWTERHCAEHYQSVQKSKDDLVREIDVILNGDAAAKQASLCDLVGQIRQQADELSDLRQICRYVYEVWAGLDMPNGSLTDNETYLLGLIKEMKDEVKPGLKFVRESFSPRKPDED